MTLAALAASADATLARLGGPGQWVTSLPTTATRDMAGVKLVQDIFGVRSAQAVDILCYWLALILAVASVVFISTTVRILSGTAVVTNPAPARNAPHNHCAKAPTVAVVPGRAGGPGGH